MDYNEDTKDCQSINLGLIDEACWPIFIQPLNGSKSDMLELVNGLETDLQLQKKIQGLSCRRQTICGQLFHTQKFRY